MYSHTTYYSDAACGNPILHDYSLRFPVPPAGSPSPGCAFQLCSPSNIKNGGPYQTGSLGTCPKPYGGGCQQGNPASCTSAGTINTGYLVSYTYQTQTVPFSPSMCATAPVVSAGYYLANFCVRSSAAGAISAFVYSFQPSLLGLQLVIEAYSSPTCLASSLIAMSVVMTLNVTQCGYSGTPPICNSNGCTYNVIPNSLRFAQAAVIPSTGGPYQLTGSFSGAGCTGVITNSTLTAVTKCTFPATGQCFGTYGSACPAAGIVTIGAVGNPTARPTPAINGPTMAPTQAAISIVKANQDLGCSTCLLSSWGNPTSAAYITQYNLMATTFQNAIYSTLNLGRLSAGGGNVTVTGFVQKTTGRRQLLAPTLTATYVVRVNSPTITATSIATSLASTTTTTALSAQMATATGSSVSAPPPIVTILTQSPTPLPTYSPKSNTSSRHMVSLLVTVVGSTIAALTMMVL